MEKLRNSLISFLIKENVIKQNIFGKLSLKTNYKSIKKERREEIAEVVSDMIDAINVSLDSTTPHPPRKHKDAAIQLKTWHQLFTKIK